VVTVTNEGPNVAQNVVLIDSLAFASLVGGRAESHQRVVLVIRVADML
jgi:hypothetical protein